MINEVRFGTQKEALWLFGQVLDMQDPGEDLKIAESIPGSRTEALFAKGTVLQLRHLSLGDYLRDSQFEGTAVVPNICEAKVEIALALMRLSASGNQVTLSQDHWGVTYLDDISIDACTATQIGDIAEVLYSLYKLFLSTHELPSPFLDQLYLPRNGSSILQWLVRANEISSEIANPKTKIWMYDMVHKKDVMYSQLSEVSILRAHFRSAYVSYFTAPRSAKEEQLY
jgi:hypothetical protein